MKTINTLPPFKRFCVTIGNLPSSYVDSMSYYECLMWLCKYLKDTVIPAVNENAEAVNELINWFNNLDVQEEINNKLDQMAESGELQEIIASYLNVNSILAYNTLADLKGAENIVEGSFVRTYGKTTYNDGLGSLYKIRTLTSGDVVDEKNIVALTNSETLIAEKIYQRDPYNNKKYLFIGDSIAYGYQGEGVDPIEGFYAKVIDSYNLNATIVCLPGYGFLGLNNTNKWEDLVANANLKNKEEYTDIIIMGGDNDSIANATTFRNAFASTINYLKTNFKNATIHVGCIGRAKTYSTEGSFIEYIKRDKIYKTESIKYGCKYIDNAFNILHKQSYFISDNVHMNVNGEKQLAYCLSQYLLNGEITDLKDVNTDSTYNNDTFDVNSSYTKEGTAFYSYIADDQVVLLGSFIIVNASNFTISKNTDITIGKLSDSYLTVGNYQQGLNVVTMLNCLNAEQSASNDYMFQIYNDYQNNLHVKCLSNVSGLSISKIRCQYTIKMTTNIDNC